MLLAALLVPAAARAASRFAPDLTWRTLATDHFLIHYHQGLEPMARRLAAVAEAVYDRETFRLDWRPRLRTHVVLADLTDQANGFTTVFPYDLVVLNATPPDGDLELMLNADRWLYLLFLHEYTHVLHLDRAAGIPLALRRVFGRVPLLFPNLFNPQWMTEGLAVYEETQGTPGGRGRGSLFNGILRAQAADGALIPISKADNPIHTWPGGAMPYLYGIAFLQDLAAHEGSQAPFALVATYSDNLIPFLLKPNFREALGLDLRVRWTSWQDRVRQALAADPAGTGPAPERLTWSGFFTGWARAAPGGGAVAYSERTANDHARILLADPADPAAPRELAWRNGGRGLAFAPDGRSVVFSQPEFIGSFRLFDDLYRADLATRRVRRLTRGARLREPDVAPDGRIVAVQNAAPDPGDTRLVLLGPDAPPGRPGRRPRLGPAEPLLSLEPGTVFAHPRFSPDGRTVAVSVWRPGRGRHIALVDVATGQARFVTGGPGQHADPAFSPDGRYLLYTADPAGRFDLFALDLASGARFRVTDAVGAAVGPEVTPDGRWLLYTALNGGGFDLYRVPFDPAAWTPVPPAAPAPAAASPAPAPVMPPVSAPRPYRPYPAALPRFWLPVIYDEPPNTFYGAFTLGTDPLGHHVYALQAAADPEDHLVEAFATYLYDRFYPSLQVSLSQDYQGQVFLAGVPVGWVWERDASADLIFPVRRFNRQEAFRVGVGLEDSGVKRDCTNCMVVGAATDLFLRLGVHHDGTQHYGLGISPTDGRRLALTTEIASDRWGSDHTGSATVLDWREYRALPPRAQVLAARVTAAGAARDLLLTAGGGPNAVEDAFDRDFSVRGYGARARVGDRLARETLSWRFPLALPEWAPGTLPLFVEKLHGNLFTDAAQVRTVSGRWNRLTGLGAEVGTDLVAGYLIPLTLRLGVAVGTGPRGEGQVYLRVEGLLL